MKTLHRYILTQQIPPFLFGIFIIIFILILDFLYKNLAVLIGKGVPIRASAELLVLSLGWMIVMAVPMAILIFGGMILELVTMLVVPVLYWWREELNLR